MLYLIGNGPSRKDFDWDSFLEEGHEWWGFNGEDPLIECQSFGFELACLYGNLIKIHESRCMIANTAIHFQLHCSKANWFSKSKPMA